MAVLHPIRPDQSFLADDPPKEGRGMPKVSIITPLYNGAATIDAAIASVQAQSLGNYEHLVIDNGSDDDSAGRVARAAKDDDRIRLLHNRAVRGAGPTRNVGIAAARGRYIAFLDSDDMWRPRKLERQVGVMEALGLAFSWTSYAVRGQEGEPVRIQAAKTSISHADLLAKRAVIGCLTAIYDAGQLGKLYMNDLPMRQDFCLWLDILRKAEEAGLKTGGIGEVLADYSAGGMTSSKMKAAGAQWRAYREHAGLSRIRAGTLFASYALRGVGNRMVRNV